jgi:hypothetical protein
MNAKQSKTLGALFKHPTPSDVRWSDVESLLLALGASISEGRGSRVLVTLNGVDAVFHRPHPKPQTDKGALVAVRKFLASAGVKP